VPAPLLLAAFVIAGAAAADVRACRILMALKTACEAL